MSAFHAALGGMITAAGVGMTMVGRSWPTGGRHRARVLDDASLLDDLLGPPTPYTTDWGHAPGPIRTGFGYCEPCGRNAGGSWNKDGFLCGECLTPSGGAG